ncbi:transglutaminase superfamily protein [Anaerobacterium chartisolvens]|uniref:Transglutaminase superfamily protein n=1 Tax=Anaerobacterium chartisolvens TaxID=1297424 RepID=A0A369B2A0_9FIRM|nr:transglutaminase-like domain-containing protein [Anaerobacterium chartisolvens]RCX15465.1 transglutaminase superfamily protein [Anaerobacterium chartisolvens]
MWRKFVISLFAAIYLMTAAFNVFAKDDVIFDKSHLSTGIIRVNYNGQSSSKLKCMVQKQSNAYYYDLASGDSFPLQFGNGEYTIAILENVEGKKYRIIKKDTVNLQLKNQNDVFLTSIKLINWNENADAVKKAKELTRDSKTDMDKVIAIYEYVTRQIAYDNKKISLIGPDYMPVIDEVLKDRKGICYDYCSLFAAMLRSVSVPTKLIMGHKNDIETYHSWNGVYIKEKGKWLTIDTAYDSILLQRNLPVSMIKEDGQYKADKEY